MLRQRRPRRPKRSATRSSTRTPRVKLVAAADDTPAEEQGYPSNLLQPTGTGGDLAAGRGLTITAANFAGQRASFAGRGSQISLAAPGAFEAGGPPGIFSSFPGNPTELEAGGSL